MKQFIFSYTWFALNYLLRLLGLNILKRDGDTGLRPTSACQFWLPLACTYFIIFGGVTTIYCYILNVEATFDEFLKNLNEKLYTNATNTFAQYCTSFCLFGMNFIGIFKLRSLSKELIVTQDYFNQNALINERLTKKGVKNSLWKSFPYISIMSIGQCLGVLGTIKLSFLSLNVSTFLVNLLVIFWSLIVLVFSAPIWYFSFIYLEVSLALNKQNWY